MSVRNRSNSKSARRRSGGANLLIKGMLFLSMLAFCFLMGFFVLSRYVPGGRGPDSPSLAASNGGDGETPASSGARRLASSSASGIPVMRHSRVAPPHPADAPGPSIEPADDVKTQKPSSIDEQSSDVAKPSTDSPASTDNPDRTDAEKGAAEVKSTDTPAIQEPGNTLPAGASQASGDAPPPRKHRKRRRAQGAEPTSGDEQKPTAREATQAPAKLDDSSDAGTKGDKGNGDN